MKALFFDEQTKDAILIPVAIHGMHRTLQCISQKIGQTNMQLFGNVATDPVRKESKTTGKKYIEMRVAESQRGLDNSPTFYTVRLMKDVEVGYKKGDFVKVTGKLKVDFYIGRDGKPTGTLLVIAFEAAKIVKPELSKPLGKTIECLQAPQPQPSQQCSNEQYEQATWDTLV